MATGKKFYWIKIKDSFMTSDKVDFLMSQKNGANYVVLYQMLCLKTINTDGELARSLGEIIMPFDELKIQRDCKYFEIDTIRIALELYKKLGMIYNNDNGILQITDFKNMVGSETDYAAQKRIQREDESKLLGVDNAVDNVHIENRDKILDIREEEKDDEEKEVKHKFGSYKNVKLTNDEVDRLKKDYPKLDINKLIEWFSAYIEEKGYKSKSHNLAIRRWVIDAYTKSPVKSNGKRVEETTNYNKDFKGLSDEEENKILESFKNIRNKGE